MEENKRVLLGMSGGTDSSVAAMRLLEAGYEVIGVTFRFYELNGSTEYLEDARNLAERLGIRHITYDAREIFSKQIIWQSNNRNQITILHQRPAYRFVFWAI